MRALPGLVDGNGEPGRFGAGRASLRRKGGALLASLLLHLLGLAGVVAAMRGPDAPPAEPRAALVTVEIRPDSPPHTPQPRRAEAQPSTAAPRALPQAMEPAPVQAAPASPTSETAPPEHKLAPPAAANPAIAPVPEARRAPASDVVEAYRIRVWRKILAARPQGARGSGRVVLRFRIDRQGRLLSAEVTRSSGAILLDRLALRAVHAAAPFAPPPAELEESGLTFSVPIDFHG